jgi:hypothetical protein
MRVTNGISLGIFTRLPVDTVNCVATLQVFLAIPDDKANDPLMINWRKNGTMPVSGAAFNGPVFNAPAYSTGGFRDPTTVRCAFFD